MVVLDNETSLAVDQFSTSMFSGISCKEVQSLTTAKEAKVQEKMNDIAAELNDVAVARKCRRDRYNRKCHEDCGHR